MTGSNGQSSGLLARLQRRGVLRVAASYAVIAWLLLQIADVVLEPLGAPAWIMRALIVAVVVGFPVAVVLAWFYELTPDGIQRDHAAAGAERPIVHGVRRYTDLILIGALVAVIAVLLVRQQGGGESLEDGPPVLAVLPFSEIGGTQDSVFGMGLADTLTHKLGQLQEVVVLASRSTMEFAGTELDLPTVGAKLGASVLVEGSVQRGAGMLRVNARLVQAANGQQLWAGSYERRDTDLFAVQDEIANAVSSALSLVLSADEQQRLDTPVASSLSAYDAYTLGRVSLAQRGQKVRDAVDFFRQAIQLDPDFALAHAALAEALWMAPSYLRQDVRWDDVADEARRSAGMAQAIDPNLGEGYMAQVYVYMADNRYGSETTWPDEQLEALLNRAIARSPSHAPAARYLAAFAEEPRERIRLLERAALLDPRSGIIGYDIAVEYAKLGEWDAAVDWLLKSGQSADPYFAIGYGNIPYTLVFYAGQLDEGARWLRLMAAALDDLAIAANDLPFSFALFDAMWDIGAREEARAVLERLPEITPPENASNLLFNQMFFAWLEGDDESAAVLLTRLEDEHLRQHAGWPNLARYPGADWILAVATDLALKRGDAAAALERYQQAFPDPANYYSPSKPSVFFQPALMTAALLKQNGRADEARALIEGFLEANREAPVNGRAGVGHARFMAHALLGDVEGARAAMQGLLEVNFTALLLLLEQGLFDEDYRAVMADPVVAAGYAELRDRVDEMRRSYLERPDLPLGRVPPNMAAAAAELRRS